MLEKNLICKIICKKNLLGLLFYVIIPVATKSRAYVLLFIFKGGMIMDERVKRLIEKPLNEKNIKLCKVEYVLEGSVYFL